MRRPRRHADYSDYTLCADVIESAAQDAMPTESYSNFGLTPVLRQRSAALSQVRQGQDRIGLGSAAGFPFLVRTRVRIPAQVPAEPQLQAPRGDPVPLDSFWR